MKRRTKRDFGLFLGVLVVIGFLIFVNTQLSRSSLAQRMDALRQTVEAEHAAEGVELLSWRLIKSTKGSLRGGGRYHEELLPLDGQEVNLIGFQVPNEQFRNVTEFLMLPIPIECYFCQMPPSRDVVLIQLKEGESTAIFAEPVLISGRLKIHEGPGVKFFYSIVDGKMGPGGDLTVIRQKLQHMLPQHEQDPDDLLEPYQSPSSGDFE